MARLSMSSVPPRLLARMCSSVAPSPVRASNASGPLQIKHLPTQFGPALRKVVSVSATRLSLSGTVISENYRAEQSNSDAGEPLLNEAVNVGRGCARLLGEG